MSTIGTQVTIGITLGTVASTGTYLSPLTITTSGAVDTATGTAVYGPNTRAWTVVNEGGITASGSGGYGIDLLAGGSVVNSGTISAYDSPIVISGSAGTLSNTGTIIGTGTMVGTIGDGVALEAGGGVFNTATAGLIEGYNNGVYITGTVGTVTNSGTIEATGSFSINGVNGVNLLDGGSVGNATSGLIEGYNSGVFAAGVGTVTNSGTLTITGTSGDGVELTAGGSVGNMGLIAGYNGIEVFGTSGTLTNFGTVTGSGTAGFGINLAAGGTVIDSGTIGGASGTAAYFGGTGGNLLVLDPGYQLGGTVVGSTSATNMLELGSTASAGTLSAVLATEFVNFDTVTVAAGAQWTLTGSSSLSGITLTDLGTLTNAGTLSGTGALVVDPASLFNTGSIGLEVTLAGGGYLDNELGGTISVAGTAVYGTLAAPTIVNAGTIKGTGTSGTGVRLSASGSVANSGLIAGYEDGVSSSSADPVTLVTTGTIAATGTANVSTIDITEFINAVNLGDGGTVINGASGSSGGLISSNWHAIDAGTAGPGTVVNFGTIISTASIRSASNLESDAIHLGGGGTVINGTPGSTGALISGNEQAVQFGFNSGTAVSGATGTVINYGTIANPGASTVASGGVIFGAGGTITNFGTIESTNSNAIKIQGSAAATISNFGMIDTGGTVFAIYSAAGGIITNHASATIESGNSAIGFRDTAGTTVSFGSVVNAGTIESTGVTNGNAVYFQQGGIITNQTGGVIDAVGGNAISVAGSAGTVSNLGTIENTGTVATIHLAAGGLIVNGASGSSAALISAVAAGNGINISAAGTLINFGTIEITGTGTAVYLGTGGTVTNGASGSTAGLITASGSSANGVDIAGGSGMVTNFATIAGGYRGVLLRGAGTVANFGTIESTGTGAGVVIRGTAAGGGPGSVFNAGTITSADYDGIHVWPANSYVGNLGTGLISGAVDGIYAGGNQGMVFTGTAGTVVNAATILGTFDDGVRFAAGGSVGNSGLIAGASVGVAISGNAGTVIDSGTISGASGTAISFGGTGSNLLVLESGYQLHGGVAGSGALGATNTLELGGSVGAAVTVGYNALGLSNFEDVLFGAGGNDTLKVSSTGGTLVPTISGFALTSDIIDLTTIGTNGTISGTIGTLVTVTGSLGSETLKLDASDTTHFTVMTDGNTGTDLVACFCRGTQVLTDKGEVAVEDLAIGDRVVTVSGAAKPIKWIGRRAYDGRFIAANRAVLPICVAAGALGEGVPARDLWLSPEHALFVDDMLVPAGLLTNGATIRQAESVDRLEYFHIELAAHEVILAEGAPAESYVDCDNRFMFQNGEEFARLYPDDRPEPWEFCAPRAQPGSAELTAIRAALFERAAALGHTLDSDPDLHLIVDGEVVPPDAVAGCVYGFTIPAGARAVWLASRSAVPAETAAGSRDLRRLGVPLESIAMRGADLSIEAAHSHPMLCEGFHEHEATHRWTDGLARVPESWLRCFSGAFVLEAQLGPRGLGYSLGPPPRARAGGA